MEKKNIKKKIDFANLQFQYQKYKYGINKKIQSVLNHSNYILGKEVEKLELALTKFTEAKYSIACSSGTDALLLSMMAIDIQPGDEIITTPFTWISTSETIVLLKAKPVFVDIEPDTFNINSNLIEKAITKKTKAIIPVSLFGQPPNIDEIKIIAKRHNLKVIIDGAQSFGSTYKNKKDSNQGDLSITSFFPSKPLGCYGDGGAVFTNNYKYAKKIKMLRSHGQVKKNNHEYIGLCGRMDTIQAAIILAKLPHFAKELKKRQIIANYFTKTLSSLLHTPVIKNDRSSTWAQYTVKIKNRDSVCSQLKKKHIPTMVFYPIPLHLQKCFKYLNYKIGDFPVCEKISKEVLSLPMNAFLNKKQIEVITSNIISIVKKK